MNYAGFHWCLCTRGVPLGSLFGHKLGLRYRLRRLPRGHPPILSLRETMVCPVNQPRFNTLTRFVGYFTTARLKPRLYPVCNCCVFYPTHVVPGLREVALGSVGPPVRLWRVGVPGNPSECPLAPGSNWGHGGGRFMASHRPFLPCARGRTGLVCPVGGREGLPLPDTLIRVCAARPLMPFVLFV